MIDPFSAKLMSITVTAGSAVVVATSVSAEHVQVLQLVAGGLLGIGGLTATVMIWIDDRMDKKVGGTRRAILKEIRHLKVLLHEKGVIDYVEPEGEDE